MAPKKTSAAAAGKKKKSLSFDESIAKEASTSVETVRAGHAVKRGVSFASSSASKNNKSNNKSTSSKAGKKKGVGIVEATRKRKRDEDEDEEKHHHLSNALVEEEDDANSLVESSSEGEGDDRGVAGDDDNLSDIADAESSDDGDDDDYDEGNPFIKAYKTGTRLSYAALRLSHLPAEFQEPQLFKFLDQFGTKVLNCFCVRSARTHQSKGIAYVQFQSESVLPLVIEECHGMALGGRSVQARKVILHRPMPTKEKVARRRKLAYAYATKGAPLKHHNVTHKSPVALVIGAAKTERQNNEHLKRLGIDFATDFFIKQLPTIPKELLTKKVQGIPTAAAASTSGSAAAPAKKVTKVEKASEPVVVATPKKSPAKAEAPAKASPKKASPKKASPKKASPKKASPKKK